MNELSRIHLTPSVSFALIFATACLMMLAACTTSDEPTPVESNAPAITATETPIVYDGEDSFQIRCSSCHGQLAEGTTAGPPLVNRLYEIGHHPNFSFHNAVNSGVTAHHWNFGDMPPIPNVESAEIDAIICHVRDLQRAEGIAAGEPC